MDKRALQAVKDQVSLGLAYRYARPVRMRFTAANTRTEVAHRCPEIPSGFHPLFCGGVVSAEPGEAWTKDFAVLRCDTANAEAVLVFVVLKEEPINVTPTTL